MPRNSPRQQSSIEVDPPDYLGTTILINLKMTTEASGNEPFPADQPRWKNEGIWVLPAWAEPVMVASILVIALYITQRKQLHIFGHEHKSSYEGLLDQDTQSPRTSNEVLMFDGLKEDDSMDVVSTMKDPPKRRRCCGMLLLTPNSSRFRDHVHSRIMQKFPFLMEIIYWIMTYGFFKLVASMSQAVLYRTNVWDIAQDHGLAIMEFEQFSWLSFLWPVTELALQQWFVQSHQTLLTTLNLLYTLIDVFGFAGFFAWYYYAAPSFRIYANVRRTVILANLIAFGIFILYPVLQPSLLSEEYGFLDPTHRVTPQSVWMSGNYVKYFASMPSTQFGFSFCVGCTLFYQSGIFRQNLELGEVRKTPFWKSFYLFMAALYPILILTTMVAMGNHYWLDACAAILVIIIAFLCNRTLLSFLPLEDLLLWCFHLNKPTPTTGEQFRPKGRQVTH